MVEATITAIFGLGGMIFGSWMTASLTTRRERWNLKRQHYERLLKHIGEAKYALSVVVEAMDERRSVTDEWTETWREHAQAAMTKIRRTTWTADLVLNDDSARAIKNLMTGWDAACRSTSYTDLVNEQLSVAEKAHRTMVLAARQDLGIRQYGFW